MRNFYRNMVEIRGEDTSSLWELRDAHESGHGEAMLVLVSDDEYVAVSFEQNKDWFYRVEAPE